MFLINKMLEDESKNLKFVPKSGKVSCAQNRFIILDYPLPPNKRFGIVYQDFTFIQFRLFRTGSSDVWDMMLYSVFFLNERKIL